MRPRLQAVILDFSTVRNVDLTAIQYLIDIRNVLDKHAAPYTVQWHFACVHSPWAKRALAAAGFGYPSFETSDGRPRHFKPVYSLADISQSDPAQIRDEQEQVVDTRLSSSGAGTARDIESGEVGGIDAENAEKLTVEALEVTRDGKMTRDQMGRMEAVHGINRPFFHPDIQGALSSAVASKVIMEAFERPETICK
jgi:solute carrier family 26 (sodium-independent sulfate anion transporter), member 11